MAKRPQPSAPEKDPFDEFLLAFAARVRAARAKRGLTYGQLGEMTGTAPSYIFTMEKEGSNVTLKTLTKLAAALGVSARDLLPEPSDEVMFSTAAEGLIANLEAALRQRQIADAGVLESLNALSTFLKRLQPPPPEA